MGCWWWCWVVVLAAQLVGSVQAAVPRPFPRDVLLVPELVRRVARAGGLAAVCRQNETATINPRWRRFALAVCETFLTRRQSSSTERRVSVVGAGPAGLLSALTAFAAGANVTVWEKRRSYRRTMWFDLSDGAWGMSLKSLNSWGFFELTPELGFDSMREKVSFDGEKVVAQVATVQCRKLEQWLAMMAALLGIDIRYGKEAASIQIADAEVVIGADGAKSKAREWFAIGEERIPGVWQDSVVVSFTHCPQNSAEGPLLSPWEFSFHDARVAMCYFRFFSSRCDLQILLVANATLSESDQFRLVRVVTRLGFPEAFNSSSHLRDSIASMQLIRATVSRSLDTTTCLNAECTCVGILVGDAVFPAHYRLGIGVNGALDSMRNLGVFLSSLPNDKLTAVEEKKALDDERMARVWRHQLRTVWLESHCEAHLFQELANPDESISAKNTYVAPLDAASLFVVRVHKGSILDRRPQGRKRKNTLPFSVVLSVDEAVEACAEALGVRPPWEDVWDPAEEAVREALRQKEGDVEGILNALDAFARQKLWLMTVGPVKGKLLQEAASRVSPGTTVIELGTYIGYGALKLHQVVPETCAVLTLENDKRRATLARRLLRHARVTHRVTVIEGTLSERIDLVKAAAPIGLVFFDHKKNKYLDDLRLLESSEMIGNAGTVIVADNVVLPGAPEFLGHLRNSTARYDTVYHDTFLEYSDIPDLMTISTVK